MFQKAIDFITRYQLALVFLALVFGFVYPDLFRPLHPLNSAFLMAIMFATGLRLDYKAFMEQVKDWRTLVLAVAMMMIIMPFLVTIPLKLFAPEWLLPFILAASMPTGLTAPAVMTIMGGRTSLALLISVSTSVTAPILVPLILQVMIGEKVAIDSVAMMLQIGMVVLIPLGLASLIRWKIKEKKIKKLDTPIKLVNLAAFALVIASVTANSVVGGNVGLLDNFFGIGIDGLIIILLMIVFWFGITTLAASLLAWRNKVDRLTVAFCLMYMNTTLGVWLADEFFGPTGIAPKMVAIFVATTMVLPVFKFFIPQEKKKDYKRIYTIEQT